MRPLRAERPRILALGQPDELLPGVACWKCDRTGYVDDGLLAYRCDACGNAGSFEVRIVAATPEMLALYQDFPMAGGYFALLTGGERRELWYYTSLEAARTGDCRLALWGDLEQWDEVIAAMGLAGVGR